MPSTPTLLFLSLLAGLTAYLATPLQRRITLMGITRTLPTYAADRFDHVVYIADTVHCEDIHYIPDANELITACEDNDEVRSSWFPGLAYLDATGGRGRLSNGTFHVVDLDTREARRLRFVNFDGPFVTHGIDVIADPAKAGGYYVFAVNHLPNPAATDSNTLPRARSQIDVFRYTAGSDTVTHARTVLHPSIQTPNDIHATSPTSFYVTNDHHYRDHGLMRTIENIFSTSTWSNVVHVTFSAAPSLPDNSDVQVTLALPNIHSANGLGRLSPTHPEITVTSAGSGHVYRTTLTNPSNLSDHSLTVHETVALDSTIDNPFYFLDPYPHVGYNASGYILAGLPFPIHFIDHAKERDETDGAYVWHVTDDAARRKRLIFEDDGKIIRGATTAVLVAIDPKLEGGKKKGWLYVASCLGKSVVAVKVDI